MQLLQNIKNLSIRYKLFFSYILLIVVPLFLFIIINSYVSSADTEEKTLASAKKVLSQATAFLEYKTSNVKSSTDILVLDTEIQDIMTRDSDYYRKDMGNAWVDVDKLKKLTFPFRSNPDISDLHFYMLDGLAGIEETNEVKPLNKINKTDWYKTLTSSNSTYQWLSSKHFPEEKSKNQIFFLKKVPSSRDLNDSIGIVKIDISEKVIKDLLNQAIFSKSVSAILTNNQNELISYASNSNIDLNLVTEIVSQTPLNDVETYSWKTLSIKDEKMLIGVQSVHGTNMRLTIIVPYKDILDLSVNLRNQMLVILLVIILFILPLSYGISISATKRIRLLIKHMKKIQQGNIEPFTLKSNNDEIGNLIYNFNYMIDQLSILMDDKFKLGKKVKNNELKALQAQINPHFLYNTLDLINWMSIKYNAPQITDVVNSLSKFYKLSLSKGEDIVTIENEIEHAITYIKIQNMRFDNCISYSIDIPKELYQYYIPKITLQPIVENSIIHGILEKDEESGTINIFGEIKDKILNIIIQDDGIGISEEKLRSLLTTKANRCNGYGIKNIDDRLKLIYGNEYGLSYTSIVGIGTTAVISIPIDQNIN